VSSKIRTLIIGLDGVPYGMLKGLADSGVMPATAKLIDAGVFKKMNSTIPEVSSVAWSSMITGTNPGRHGIFGFMDLQPGSYKMKFPNFTDLKAPPFWEQWQEKSVIVNVPSTYPVRPMNGVHISGFVSLDFDKSVYPASLVPQLKSMDYRLDANSELAHSNMDLFLQDVDNTLAGSIKAGRYLWDYTDWQNFMFTFTTTDRLMHFLYSAYEDKDHKYRYIFLEHFRKIDKAIGEMAGKIGDRDLLVMLSDHGFERLDYDVQLNYLLAQHGFLKFENGPETALQNIAYGTKAFALEPARIYLNYKGKYPAGSVEPDQAAKILSELKDLLTSLKVDGKNVIRDVYTKQQLYTGPCVDIAPDLICVGAAGFNLRSSFKASKLSNKPVFTGKHTQDTAFLLVKGTADAVNIPDVPTVADVKGVIEANKNGA